MNTIIPKKTRTTTTPMVTSKRVTEKSVSMPIFAGSANTNNQGNQKSEQQRQGKNLDQMKREIKGGKGGKHRSGLSVRMDRKFFDLAELTRNVLKIASSLTIELEETKKLIKENNIITQKNADTAFEQLQILKDIQLSYEDASESDSEIDIDVNFNINNYEKEK